MRKIKTLPLTVFETDLLKKEIKGIKKSPAFEAGISAYKNGIAKAPSLDPNFTQRLTVKAVQEWEAGWSSAADTCLAALG